MNISRARAGATAFVSLVLVTAGCIVDDCPPGHGHSHSTRGRGGWDPSMRPDIDHGGAGGASGGSGRPGTGGAPAGANPDAGGPGGSNGSSSIPTNPGYCSSDAACGAGLVCDRTLGACASPRGGCGMAAFQPTRTAGEMVLVLDRSNSMRENTPTGTRWSDLTTSITHVLAARSDVAWGLSLFPASDAEACLTTPLAIAPAAGAAAAISVAIGSASPTGSGTPTRQAVLDAGNALLGASRPTRKYLLLATDGEPNCTPGGTDGAASDVVGTTRAVRALAEQGLSTFVLGLAVGQSASSALASMAQAGGHARSGPTAYYTASDANELEAALAEVARLIAVCTFDLAPPPPAGATPSLSIGGTFYPRNPAHTGDGWDITGAGKAIELYGAACDAIQSGASIQISYGCGQNSRCDAQAMACVPVGLP